MQKMISKYHTIGSREDTIINCVDKDKVKYLSLRQMRSREDNIMEGRAEQTWGLQGSMGRSRVNQQMSILTDEHTYPADFYGSSF